MAAVIRPHAGEMNAAPKPAVISHAATNAAPGRPGLEFEDWLIGARRADRSASSGEHGQGDATEHGDDGEQQGVSSVRWGP